MISRACTMTSKVLYKFYTSAIFCGIATTTYSSATRQIPRASSSGFRRERSASVPASCSSLPTMAGSRTAPRSPATSSRPPTRSERTLIQYSAASVLCAAADPHRRSRLRHGSVLGAGIEARERWRASTASTPAGCPQSLHAMPSTSIATIPCCSRSSTSVEKLTAGCAR